MKILREEEIGKPKASGEFVAINRLRHNIVCIKENDGKILIERIAVRSKIRNIVDSYELVSNGNVEIRKLDLKTANHIVDSIVYGKKEWSDAFVVPEEDFDVKDFDWTKSEKEHKFTSTGIKFWRHKESMESYRSGGNRTVISTHISPEGACNLKCPYCSVTYRDTHSRIALPRIKDYVTQLKDRGLKAAILSGGGEPTLYKQFPELVSWLKYDQGLSVGLITNGTQFKRFPDEIYKAFSWIRISVNVFDGWEDKIGSNFKKELLDPECVTGCSMVYTVEHQSAKDAPDSREELFKKVGKIADRVGAEYIRLLPNCLLEQKQLLLEHAALQKTLEKINDGRFFQQYKVHGAPKSSVCHQAYFRPYLSEEPWEDGEPGTVYPCDSVVLNDSVAHFNKVYGVAKLEDVGKFMDGKITMKFDPREKCHGCVFTDNVNTLDGWKNEGKERFEEFSDPLKHEEFV
jgi:MoaA/NifB/PqqE/SkfB family radical SAM enzyme